MDLLIITLEKVMFCMLVINIIQEYLEGNKNSGVGNLTSNVDRHM
jgi:hypothetical protein